MQEKLPQECNLNNDRYMPNTGGTYHLTLFEIADIDNMHLHIHRYSVDYSLYLLSL